MILVHGAGSFGHPIAKKYKLNQGYLGPESSKGFALCKKAVLNLSLLVWEELTRAGINASIVQPSAIVVTSKGKIVSFDLKQIKGFISKDITPILFGDMVLDKNQGFAVLSGDVIASYLGSELKAKKIIFVSDVEGVFDKNPMIYNDAKLIKDINNNNFNEIIQYMMVRNKENVSGEMKGKITSIKEVLPKSKTTIIGYEPFNLKKALLGERLGTSIRFNQ